MGDCNSKCSYCERNKDLNHSSENCEEESTCTCKCNVGGGHDIAQKASSITTGVGLTIGGIAVCVLSGGLAAPFVGAAIAGAGVSAAANGITKSVKGEKMDAADFFIDTGVGVVTGALTAGGGAAGGLMKKAAEEGVKMTLKETTKHIVFKTAVMGVTGVGTSAISEGINCTKPLENGKKERKFNPHCLWVGGAVGGLGAAGSSLSKGVANKAADQFAAKVAGEAVSKSRGVIKVGTRCVGESVTGTVQGTVNSAGKLAASNSKDAKFDWHELWAGAAQGGASSLCRESTTKLTKKDQDINTTSSKSSASMRAGVRFSSAVVETAANEGIIQAKQAVTGEVDETRHFGKSFCIGLIESSNTNLGRYSEKCTTRRNRQAQHQSI